MSKSAEKTVGLKTDGGWPMPTEPATATITRLFTPKTFAETLGIGKRTFQTWRAAGKLPAPDLIEGRIIRWRPETVDRWLRERAEVNT